MIPLRWQEKIFDINTILIYLLLVASIVNARSNAHTYLLYLLQIVQIYVCMFLLWRFNPFFATKKQSKSFTDFDKKIAFNAGFILLTSNIINMVF
jgi:hypothetical protein